MHIENSTEKDIPEIFRLYKLATALQKEKFPENQWPEFDRQLIETEVAEKRQFKINIDGKVACVWAITYSDPEIWKQDDGVSSIYIHRIAVNPDFRGNNYVKLIVEWAKNFAQDKKFIRMDTCGENLKLIQHYQNCGFEFLGIKKLQQAVNLPAHYQNADVCYFEIKL
ncbi:GNAT family N-acetyltransferase [Arachidicoccus ginsenosidivorans]|uniref:GNAT family N-acetyltransferase n=1 Tax=Arachidicoccus ginsenosidivorans TaxID=496057 RepID=A0A5B8VM84_9BACT|nr:GNAT family N-acetyltransferase [Arachidicoccus ginsenosidivorans]QEC72085.1 GNAT family N-acetyltransferase [Arachidicoccus ginsenosidivorans]